jgi:hypothetical protein
VGFLIILKMFTHRKLSADLSTLLAAWEPAVVVSGETELLSVVVVSAVVVPVLPVIVSVVSCAPAITAKNSPHANIATVTVVKILVRMLAILSTCHDWGILHLLAISLPQEKPETRHGMIPSGYSCVQGFWTRSVSQRRSVRVLYLLHLS